MHRWLLALLVAATAAVDIDTANEAALRGAGFTASQAAQIVSYRGENGPFLQVDELLAVPQMSRAALAPLRDKLTLGGGAPPKPAAVTIAGGGPPGVRASDLTAEWRNLYGVVVYAVNASLENTGAQPVRAIRVRVDLLDAAGAVVASATGYNLGAEALLEVPDTAIAALPAIAPGGRDPLRLTIEKPEISRPFTTTRLTIVDAR
jgi:hypothetical protein